MQRWNMMRTVLAMALTLGVGAGLLAVVAGAQAEEFETVEVTLIACRIVSDDMVMNEGAVHIRRRVLVAAALSDDPYFAGTATVISNADVFPAAGRAVLQGFIEIRPDAFAGFWSGSFAMVMDEDGQRGWTVSQGNGPDLRGLYVESVLRQLPPPVVAEYAWACGGEAPISGSVATGKVARLRPDAP
jgi:hypothetical protein